MRVREGQRTPVVWIWGAGLVLLVALGTHESASATGKTPAAGMRRLSVDGIGSIFCAELDAAGQTVAVGDRVGNLALVHLAHGKTLGRVEAHRGETRTLAFDPDPARPWLYSGGEDGLVIAWDRRSGKRVKEVRRGDHPVRDIVVGRQLLVVAAERPQVELIHHGAQKKKALLAGHKAWVRALALSPDEKWLASGDRDGKIRLWHVPSARLRKTITAHSLWVNALAFGPRSQRLASAGFEKRVRIWSVPGGKRMARFRGHVRRVADLSFHPDGHQLASACLDRTAGIWDLKKGRLATRLDGHRYQVSAVAYSPRGDFVLTASGDGYLRTWALPIKVSSTVARLPEPGPGEITLRNNTTGERTRVRLVDGKGKLLPSGRRALSRALRSMPDSAVSPPHPKLAELLYKVADHFGRHHEVIFISGHRSPAFNQLRRKQSKQVARKSRHVTGEAMDLRIDGVTITALVKHLKKLEVGGVGYYPDSQFVHMDVGPPRSWGGN